MRVIKFGAEWCIGCIVMKPRWEQIENDIPWLQTEMHDFDDDKDAVNKYGIDDILPVCIFLDMKGEEFLRLSGEVKKEKLINIINDNKDR